MIHPPQHITSTKDLGLNTTKSMEYLSDAIGIGTEIWSELETPWQEGKTIIAKPGYTWRTKWERGKPYIITKFYTATGQLAGIYCDVCRPVVRTKNGFAFDDLYLDVWQIPGSAPVILDEDELQAAVVAGHITTAEAKTARSIAAKLVSNLQNDSSLLNF